MLVSLIIGAVGFTISAVSFLFRDLNIGKIQTEILRYSVFYSGFLIVLLGAVVELN